MMVKYGSESISNMDAFTFLNEHADFPREQLYLYSTKDLICRAPFVISF